MSRDTSCYIADTICAALMTGSLPPRIVAGTICIRHAAERAVALQSAWCAPAAFSRWEGVSQASLRRYRKSCKKPGIFGPVRPGFWVFTQKRGDASLGVA